FRFSVNSLAYSLIFIIPWALLVATLLTFGRLSANNELTALRMTGRSLHRICAPVFFTAILCALATLWVNVEAAPRSKANISQLFFRIATENPGSMFLEDEFVNTFPGYSAYTKTRNLIDQKSGHYDISNLVLVKLDAGRKPEIFIQAEQAEIRFEEGNREDLFLELNQAHLESTPGTTDAEFFQHDLIKPGHATLKLSLEKLREKEKKQKPSYLPSRELIPVIDAEESPKRKAYLRTELHKRYSLSCACLAFCLVGIPLGVTAQRKETSTGLALSIAIAACYFVLLTTAEIFHEDPSAYPHILIWLPNIIFIPVGLILFHRLSRK
ncbi:MAG: LptF/LptG family permease, partial [Verrucomicrobiota bacterium]